MIKNIGINYIGQYDDIYKYLIKKRYINTLKFPGRLCNYNELSLFKKIIDQTKAKVDLHGLPNLMPDISSINCVKDMEWGELKKYPLDVNRISIHVGLENRDRISNYPEGTIEKQLHSNKMILSQKLKEVYGKEVKIGLENVPGKIGYEPKTLEPEYVSWNWKEADFAVFDIIHARLACEELNITYEEFLNRLENKEKVKILHVSGNQDDNNKYPNSVDKHLIMNRNEITDIIDAINMFKNIDLVVSEYAYPSKYGCEKELLIEAITLHTVVTTKNEEKSKEILEYLENNLEDNGENIEQLIETIESK